MGIGPLLQFPHLLRAGPVLLTLLFFPLVPSSYRVLCGAIYYFSLVRYSCPLSAGVLHALLCLKVCSWCIMERDVLHIHLLLHHLVLSTSLLLCGVFCFSKGNFYFTVSWSNRTWKEYALSHVLCAENGQASFTCKTNPEDRVMLVLFIRHSSWNEIVYILKGLGQRSSAGTFWGRGNFYCLFLSINR